MNYHVIHWGLELVVPLNSWGANVEDFKGAVLACGNDPAARRLDLDCGLEYLEGNSCDVASVAFKGGDCILVSEQSTS